MLQKTATTGRQPVIIIIMKKNTKTLKKKKKKMQLPGREHTSLGLIGHRRNHYATDTEAN